MYQPDLIIGVTHLPQNLEVTLSQVIPLIRDGTIVGLEPYSVPIQTGIWEQPWCDYYNGLAKKINEGGVCIPLGDEKISLMMVNARRKIMPEFKMASDKFKAIYGQDWWQPNNPNHPRHDDAMNVLSHDLLVKYGFGDIYHEAREMEIRKTQLGHPRIVVIGEAHLPHFMIAFPNSEFRVIPHQYD